MVGWFVGGKHVGGLGCGRFGFWGRVVGGLGGFLLLLLLLLLERVDGRLGRWN